MNTYRLKQSVEAVRLTEEVCIKYWVSKFPVFQTMTVDIAGQYNPETKKVMHALVEASNGTAIMGDWLVCEGGHILKTYTDEQFKEIYEKDPQEQIINLENEIVTLSGRVQELNKELAELKRK